MSSTEAKIRISVFGLGYVGSVMVGCLARFGHSVIGVDSNPTKVELLNEGRCLMVEPELDAILAEEFAAGRIRATVYPAEAILQSDLSFVCVGTPSFHSGRLDSSSVQRVSRELGRALAAKKTWHTFAIRSTVLPGTTESMVIPLIEAASGKRVGVDFAVCDNPEFIREGSAIQDFFNPSFTVMGANDPSWLTPLREVYANLPGQFFELPTRTSEMVKYACNTFHALKIDFANEIDSLARKLGADGESVMNVLCADTKLNISRAYLKPGFAFGGSCLPKDVGALAHSARQMELTLPLLQAILPSNQAHINRALESVLATGKRKIGVLGLSFKNGTDDLRESASLQLIKRLIGEGRDVLVYDPTVERSFIHGSNRKFAETEIPHIFGLLRTTLDEVVGHSELIIIGNKDPEYLKIVEMTTGKMVVDLVGMPWPAAFRSSKVILSPEFAVAA